MKRTFAKFILALTAFIALFANFISSDIPIFFKYQDHYYFPLVKIGVADQVYNEKIFNTNINMKVNFKDPVLQNLIKEKGYIIFPFNPYLYNTLDIDYNFKVLQPPSRQHLLGTNSAGKDILALGIYSIRNLFYTTFFISIVSILLALLCGILQGYLGKITDLILQRVYEIIIALPLLYVLLFIAATSYFNQGVMFSVIALFSCTFLIPYIRFGVLRIKAEEYITSAQTLGLSKLKIMWAHILPNILPLIKPILPVVMISNIFLIIGLDFLNQIPDNYGEPSFGLLLLEGKSNLDSPWILATALVPIFLIALSLSIIFEEKIND
ncbi:ABC transporter permease protein [Candidatus Hepatincolaceae symbiont of Richtersius coronifer]